MPATPQQLKTIAGQQQARQRQQQRVQAGAEALKEKLERLALTLTLSVGAEEKSFGSVTVHDVVDALAREGISVERHAVQLAEPIKTLGAYALPVRLHPGVTATLKVRVVKSP